LTSGLKYLKYTISTLPELFHTCMTYDAGDNNSDDENGFNELLQAYIDTLSMLKESITGLHVQNLFPYKPEALLRRLQVVMDTIEQSGGVEEGVKGDSEEDPSP
jgi:Lines C-terminus